MYRVLLLLFCFNVFKSMAQEILDKNGIIMPECRLSNNRTIYRSRHITGTLGLSYARQLEERLSPLVYNGFGFTGNVRYEKIKGYLTSQLRLQRYLFSMGNYALSNPISTPLMNARIYSTRLSLQYQYLKIINRFNKDGLKIFAGGAFGILGFNRFHGNFYNNAHAYTWFAGVSGCGGIRYPFKAFERSWELTVQAQVSLAGLRIQQAYGSSWPEGFLEPGTKTIPGTINSLTGAGIWNFLSSTWGWDIRYYLLGGNFISFGTNSFFHSSPGQGQTKFRLAENSIQLGGGVNF